MSYSIRKYLKEDVLVEAKVNKNLHLDTDAEKGRRLQAMIDKAQNEDIKHNRDDIEKNKAEIENIKRGRK